MVRIIIENHNNFVRDWSKDVSLRNISSEFIYELLCSDNQAISVPENVLSLFSPVLKNLIDDAKAIKSSDSRTITLRIAFADSQMMELVVDLLSNGELVFEGNPIGLNQLEKLLCDLHIKTITERSFIFEQQLCEGMSDLILDRYLTTENKLAIERTSKGSKAMVDRSLWNTKYLETSLIPSHKEALNLLFRCGSQLRRIGIKDFGLNFRTRQKTRQYAFKVANRFPLLQILPHRHYGRNTLSFRTVYFRTLAQKMGFL